MKPIYVKHIPTVAMLISVFCGTDAWALDGNPFIQTPPPGIVDPGNAGAPTLGGGTLPIPEPVALPAPSPAAAPVQAAPAKKPKPAQNASK
jgi:hypothetical protein